MDTADLFSDELARFGPCQLGPDAWYMPGAARRQAGDVLDAIGQVVAQAPFRHLQAPGGKRMSVAMSNCGQLGWVSDQRGYRYQARDPLSGHCWPAMPPLLRALAQELASQTGYRGFQPDVCLINRYEAGARMGLHQDRDECDFSAPIVSVSLGLSATFIWGGLQRRGKTQRFSLHHGDALVWGGEDRLRFHGVAPLKPGYHPLTGEVRLNLTFRQAGL